MKILMTADAVGGVWTYAIELATVLAAYDVQVALATMGCRPTNDQRRRLFEVPGAALFESDFKLEWMDDPWDDVHEAGKWLLDLERQFEPDVIHLNGYAHGCLPWHAPKLVVAHSCVYSWWLAVKGELPPAEDWEAYRQSVIAGLSAADYIVAPSRAMLHSLMDLYGARENMAVVENARNPVLFRPAAEKQLFVFSAGRLWDQAKNIAQLQRVCGELPWPVCVSGNADYPGGAPSFADSKTCMALGQLDQNAFAEVLGRAAIFCLPAKYEPFGLCVLEAALSGCALVLGDIPSLRELWGDAALFVEPDNDEHLTDVLRQLIANPLRRAQLSERAQSRARYFSPERMAAKYLQIYSTVVERALRSNKNASENEVHACGL